MKVLSEKTRKTLNLLTNINNSMVVEYPIMNVRLDTSIIAYLDVSKLDPEQEPFPFFGICNFSDLYTFVSFIENPEIELNGKVVEIKNAKSKIRFVTSHMDLLREATLKLDILERMRELPIQQEFLLTKQTLQSYKKFASMQKDQGKLNFNTESGKLILKVYNTEHSANTYEDTIDTEVNSSYKFNLAISMFKRIPDLDYNVKVVLGKKGLYACLFEATALPLTIIIPGEEVKDEI